MEELLSGIKDPAFRSRFVVEYDTVNRWSGKVAKPGSRILDFGCGQGIAALGFALRNPSAKVSGIDVGEFQGALPELSRRNLGKDIPANLEFHVSGDDGLPFADGSLDLVYSWSVFEHIRRDLIPQILAGLSKALKDDGELFIQIDPLYFSPKGAHLYDALKTPWVHLLEQHDVLREKVLAAELPDRNKAQLIRQYESLNRITVQELTGLLEQGGFEVVRKNTVKCDLVPPEALRTVYTEEALTTSTVYLLATKRR